MAKNPLLKEEGTEVEYTPELIKELAKCKADPKYCITTYFKVETVADGLQPLVLRDYQLEMLDLFINNQYAILMCSRQVGKSTVAAAYMLWFCLFNNNKTCLIVSNNASNALEILHRVKIAYMHLPDWLRPSVKADDWAKTKIGFGNDMRIIAQATTEVSGTGLSISLLFADELAKVGLKNKKIDVAGEFLSSVMPTLGTSGQMIVASTPFTDDDAFAQLWRGAELEANGFAPLKKTWEVVKTRDEKWKKNEIARIGQVKFDRDYNCIFAGRSDGFIQGTTLTRLVASTPIKKVKDFKMWQPIKKDMIYIIALDPSTGTDSDFSVIEVLEFPTLVQVGEYRSNITSTAVLYKIFMGIIRLYEKDAKAVYYSVENNGIGEGILTAYDLDPSPPEKAEMVNGSGKRKGFTTTGKSKNSSSIKFKNLLEQDKIKINSSVLITELKGYVQTGLNYEARAGYTDDAISAILIAMRIIDYMITWDDDAMDAYEEEITGGYFEDEDLRQIGGADDFLPVVF
jgi:hypothetical protein